MTKCQDKSSWKSVTIPRPNEIESIVDHQLGRVEEQIGLIRGLLEESRQKCNGRAWLTMVAEMNRIQTAVNSLDMFHYFVRGSLKFENPHEGADG